MFLSVKLDKGPGIYPKVTIFHISSIFVGILKANYKCH